MPRPRSLSLTFRLLNRVRRHRVILVAAVVSMIVAALAETAPIALAKGAVGVVFVQDGGQEPSVLTDWFTDAGVWWAEVFGMDQDDPRLAALGFIVVMVLIVGLVSAVATYASTFFGRYMAALVVKDLRCALMRRILAMQVKWFTRRKVGDLLSRFATDVEHTYLGVHTFLTVLILQPLILLFATTAAFVLNWRLALASTIILPLLGVPLLMIGRRVRRHSRRSLVSLGEAAQTVNQALSGLKVIKAFGAEDYEEKRYEEVNEKWLQRQLALTRAKASSRGLMDLVYGLSLGVALAIGGYLVITGEWGLDAEEFGAFLVALATMYRPMRRLTKAYNGWQGSMAAAERVFAVLDARDEDEEPTGHIAAGPITKGIVFEGVSFSYRDDGEPEKRVLSDISFEIPAGKTVALVGPSGAGKSTIADLIFRFRQPDEGRVLVDDVPIEDLRLDTLLDQIAIVSQRPFVFNASIRENIAYSKPDAASEEIEAAARAAQIHDLIMSLPDGYDSFVGEQGAALSGGQLQRVTIARAILKDASFLLLDEATSSLDAESERAVQIALKNLLRGKTTLVIAHRLSTIVDTDLILVVENGRIVEQGTHSDLLDNDGTYARLYRAHG